MTRKQEEISYSSSRWKITQKTCTHGSWNYSHVPARKIKPLAEVGSGNQGFGEKTFPLTLATPKSNCVLGVHNKYNLRGSKIPNVHIYFKEVMNT